MLSDPFQEQKMKWLSFCSNLLLCLFLNFGHFVEFIAKYVIFLVAMEGFSLHYISLVIIYVYEVYWFQSINFLSLYVTISILYSLFILSYTTISSAHGFFSNSYAFDFCFLIHSEWVNLTVYADLYCCSVSKWCWTLCNPMDTPGFPVLHRPIWTQIKIPW